MGELAPASGAFFYHGDSTMLRYMERERRSASTGKTQRSPPVPRHGAANGFRDEMARIIPMLALSH